MDSSLGVKIEREEGDGSSIANGASGAGGREGSAILKENMILVSTAS